MSDLISRQAAIDAIYKCTDIYVGNLPIMVDKSDAYKALAALPPAQPEKHTDERTETHACDCISREAAIHLIAGYNGVVDKSVAKRLLIQMPSAQPERKMGKWIYNSPVTMKCDQCGFVIKDWDWHRFKFCPNCDCDMRGEQDE